MAEDKEVLKEVWEGRIPVRFELAAADVSTMEPPDHYFLLVPRVTYISLIMDKVKRHFQKHVQATEGNQEMWFEFDGQPLKWHIPVGLLFDLLAHRSMLPWNIIVHFSRFPEEELLRCPSEEAVEAHFMATIKEADCLKHRSAVINNMTKRDHTQLWTGLKADRFDLFWSSNKRLMQTKVQGQANCPDYFRAVPVRIYQADKQYVQPFFRPVDSEDKHLTLRDMLHEAAPDSLPESGIGLKAVINGIEAPMETKLQWLSEHLSHPDNFLHIAIINSDEGGSL
ncbi:autophagy protein 5-like [Sycon ciliatum]|uniref:autophagy protein 5-like n=1 Tax=Sycon ciliatum TaxID=27933 RepID=UPI0020A8B770|eukprot:scpid54509/ scgid25132/ Autophagy protein 5; APG5-like